MKSDVYTMLEVVDTITQLPEMQITRNHVIDVFCQSTAKTVKDTFAEIPIYSKPRKQIIRTKEEAEVLLDNLISCGLIEEVVCLQKNSRSLHCSIFIHSIFHNANNFVENRNWEFLLKRK